MTQKTRQFTLLEFNEDALVLSLPELQVLGVVDDWADEPLGFKQDDPSVKLLTALGWEFKPLTDWQDRLLNAAMRETRELMDFEAGSPVSTGPATLLLETLGRVPELLQGGPLTAGNDIDERDAPLEAEFRLVKLAERYGFIPFLADRLTRENAPAAFDDALIYLNDHCCARNTCIEAHPDYPGVWQVIPTPEEVMPF